jgi:uncharacterized protein YxjI
MPRTLVISNKLLSILGRMSITDDSGAIAYEARGGFAIFRQTWRIEKGSQEVAAIRRKILAWASTWKVTGQLGDFSIRRKILSWRHRYKVSGGPFDGAAIVGNLWDLKFAIGYRGEPLARAAGTLLTLRDRHTIEILQDGDAAELFTVITMVTLHLDRRDEKRKRRTRAEEEKGE